MAKKDRKRLAELRAKDGAGTLTYLERIELELLLEEDEKVAGPEVEAGAWEEPEEEKFEPKVVEGPRSDVPPATEKAEEVEVLPVTEEMEEEKPAEGPRAARPAKPTSGGPEQRKVAAAFGAGAIVGYFLRELLEDEKKDAEPEEQADD